MVLQKILEDLIQNLDVTVMYNIIAMSANALVQAQNEFKRKQVEVETAKKEAERIAVLDSNKGAIEYMNAMSQMIIAEAIKRGRSNVSWFLMTLREL